MTNFVRRTASAITMIVEWLAEGSVGYMLYQMTRPDVLASGAAKT